MSTTHELLLSDRLTKTIPPFQVNIREVGFAISQLLPVIVETLLLPENSTLLLEQPELHLAPGIQSELADLLIDVAAQ